MKKLFYLLIVSQIFLITKFEAQSLDQNYVLTTEYLESVLVESDFNSSFGGWLPNGSVALSLENGRIKANVNSSYEGVKKHLNGFVTKAGEVLNINITLDKGNTLSNIRIYLQEINPSGTTVSWNLKDGNVQTGTHQYSHVMANSGNSITFRVDKANTNTTSNTHFFIDYISLKQGGDINAIKKLESVTYLDGFGNAKQSIAIKQSATEKDIIQHFEQDEFGRTIKQYLPLPTTQNTGNYISNAQSQITSYYQNTFVDQHPFTEVRYENSPLNRKLETAAPGNTWQLLSNSDTDHTTKYDSGVNVQNEVLRIDIDESNTSNPLVITSYLPEKLFKTIIKNENWIASDGLLNTKEIFTDNNGRKIAEFSYVGESSTLKKLYTHYVYDKLGNLRFVLTPKMLEGLENYDNYSVLWPTEGFVSPSGYVGNFGLHILNNNLKLTFYKKTTIGGIIINPQFYILKNQTIKALNTSLQLPNMYLGKVMAVNSNQLGAIPFEVGEASIQNGDLYIDRTSSQSFLRTVGSININLSTNVNLSGSILNDLAFQYKYDVLNRQIEQKVPGKDWEYMVYDQLDRPILTQDANLKAQDNWLFNKYDVFGRVAYSGIYTNSSSRAVLQAQVNNFINGSSNKTNIVSRTATTSNIGGVIINYTNDAFPNTNQETLTVNYYDDYSFSDPDLPTSLPTIILGQTVTNRTKGFLTGTWSKTLASGLPSWTKNYTFYDEKSRIIDVININHLGGYTEIKSQLDFRGKADESITTHKRSNVSSLLTINDYFEYDHVERPIKHSQKINSQPTEVISEYTSNELGQLISKDVGGNILSASPLQTVNYTYNIRGWVTNVNDVNNMGNDLFAYNLKYDEAIEGSAIVGNTYNGNIKQATWKSSLNNTKKSYAFEYDKLNRFTRSVYRENNSLTGGAGKFETYDLKYDSNGNIGQLKRNSNSGSLMDRLGYTYDNGNKLLAIGDFGGTNDGFYDGSTSSNDYFYDANGNLTKDLNKDITDIEYNHLDLVKKVTFGNGNRIEFNYDANGNKLQMRSIVAEGSTTIIDYLGAFQYTNSLLNFFATPEGYASNETGGFKYIYVYKDYLGNNRVSYTDSDGSGTVTPSEVISNTNYYVMGLTHSGEFVSGIASNYNYKFQGKEQLAFSGYNMYSFGSRMYDASVGRWFNVDPQNQFWSPYLSMGNVWVTGIDPNGEWFHILIGAGVGGVVNLVSNWGNIDSFGDGLAYFGVGAASGAVTAATGNPLLGAGILSAGNSAYSQYDQTGTVDPLKLLGDTTIGVATSGIGSKIAPLIAPYTNKLFSNVSNTLVKKYLSDAASNTVSGFSLTTISSLSQGNNIGDALQDGANSIPQSLTISVIGTTGSHLNNKYYNNKRVAQEQAAEAARQLRRERIQKLAEANAKRRLEEYESNSGGHLLSKHGPQTTFGQQMLRAHYGQEPNTFLFKYATNSTKFLSYRNALNASMKAQSKYLAIPLDIRNSSPRISIPVESGNNIGGGYLKQGFQINYTKHSLFNFQSNGTYYTGFPYFKE